MTRRAFLALLLVASSCATDEARRWKKRPINPPGGPQPRPPEKPQIAPRPDWRSAR